MNPALVIAGREIREAVRNRWVVAATVLLAGLALTLAFLGSAPTGTLRVSPITVTVVGLSSLSIYLVPLIALLLAFDAVIGEVERGTMLLLLTYPVARWKVIVGKFMGHIAIIAFATVIGYACAGLATGLGEGAGDPQGWRAFAVMIGSSVLLGAAFLAIGYLVSVLSRARGTAAGAAVAVWVFFVLLYDLALLGALAADQGQSITAGMVEGLLLINPADAYRLFNLAGFENVRSLSGMAALGEVGDLGRGQLLAALIVWIAAPLALAVAVFQRREL